MKAKIQFRTVPAWLLSVSLFFLTALFDFANTSDFPDVIANPEYRIKTIVLDAGHGGKDPGCHGDHVLEKDIALKIVKELGAQISQKYPDIRIVYTRSTDVFIPLHERASIANRNKADLFISVHCNYIAKRNKAIGTETFVMGLHRAQENLDVAKRENASIRLEDDHEAHYDGYDPDSPESHILMSMYQNAYLSQSILLAQKVEEKFSGRLKRKSRGVKQAGFLVLRKTTMPAVLIEAGFLSTDEEEAFLANPLRQKDMAGAILEAVTDYRNIVEGRNNTNVDVAESESAATESQIRKESTVKNNTSKPEVQQGVNFRIQLAASKSPINTSSSKWSTLADLEVKKENHYYKYLVGSFAELNDANERRKQLKELGFDGAFVVAYLGGTRITREAAAKYARSE